MLELRSVGFHYPGGRWIIRDVTLQVPAGSLTSILGPNGRGKTTLVRCAAGLLSPQEGRVRADGPVGFVPQARGAAFAYRAVDMVVMGRARHIHAFGTPNRADLLAARTAMERVGVADLADRAFPRLSGGEQQLVLIARAVASESPILALDEPCSGLDLHNQARILALLRALAAGGLSVLLTTHHPDHARYLADSAVLMHADGSTSTGAAGTVLTDRALSDLYGIAVRTVTYSQDGAERRAIVTQYDGVAAPASATAPSPAPPEAERALTPGPASPPKDLSAR